MPVKILSDNDSFKAPRDPKNFTGQTENSPGMHYIYFGFGDVPSGRVLIFQKCYFRCFFVQADHHTKVIAIK